MTTRIISIAIAAGLALSLVSPANAHDEVGVAARVGPAYVPYHVADRDDYRHWQHDRRWYKHGHRHKKLHHRYRQLHDRWHWANDRRHDRFYWRDHAHLHSDLGLDHRYEHHGRHGH
jgi:hypothetical protein